MFGSVLHLPFLAVSAAPDATCSVLEKLDGVQCYGLEKASTQSECLTHGVDAMLRVILGSGRHAGRRGLYGSLLPRHILRGTP